MANRQSIQSDAARFGLWLTREAGRELRLARITAGLRQTDVAKRLATSVTHVSRVENGLIRRVGLYDVSRHAAAVGLKPYMRFYPAVARPLDHAQLALLEAFRSRIATAWSVALEVPMPIAGDLRAVDAIISLPGCRCAVEVITRLADLQAQLRSARLKQRDVGADRLIFVVRGSTTNRRVVRSIGSALESAFPIGTRLALQRLAGAMDPGGDALILL